MIKKAKRIPHMVPQFTSFFLLEFTFSFNCYRAFQFYFHYFRAAKVNVQTVAFKNVYHLCGWMCFDVPVYNLSKANEQITIFVAVVVVFTTSDSPKGLPYWMIHDQFFSVIDNKLSASCYPQLKLFSLYGYVLARMGELLV